METFIINTQFKCTLCNDRISGKNCNPDGCQCIFHRKCLQDWINQAEIFICPNRKCSIPFKSVLLKKEPQGPTVKSIPLVNEVHECPICCENLKKPYAAPECCNHMFCHPCLEEWSKVRHVCPLDRRPFSMINIFDNFGGPVVRSIIPPAVSNALEEEDIMAGVTCEICNSETQEELMLLCDNCDLGYHTFCLPNPLTTIPEGDWYCPNCENNPNTNQSHENFIDEECLEGSETSDGEETEAENHFTELNESGQIAAQNRALRNYRGSTRLNSVIESLASRINTRNNSRQTSQRRTRNTRRVNEPSTANTHADINVLNDDSDSEDENISAQKKRHAIIQDDSEDEDRGIIDTRNVSNLSSEAYSESDNDSEDYAENDDSPVKGPRTRSRIRSESEDSFIIDDEEGDNDESEEYEEEEDDDEGSNDRDFSMSGSDLSLNKIKQKHQFQSDSKVKTRKRKVSKRKPKKRKLSSSAATSSQPKKKRQKRARKKAKGKKKKTRSTALRKAVLNSSLNSSANYSAQSISPVKQGRGAKLGIVGKSFSLPKATKPTTKSILSDEEEEETNYLSSKANRMNSSSSALDKQNGAGFLSRIVNAQSKMMSKTSIKEEESSQVPQNSNNSNQTDATCLWSEREIERVRKLTWDLLKRYQKEYKIENSRIMMISEKCIQKIMKKPPYCITDSRATNFINAYIDYDKKVSKLKK